MSVSMPVRAVFFDMDDTLVDYTASAHVGLHETALEVHALVPEIPAGAFLRAYENLPRAMTHDRATHGSQHQIADALAACGIDKPRTARAMYDHYLKSRLEVITLMPGAIEALHFLRQHCTVGLLSNGLVRTRQTTMSRLGLQGLLDPVLISEQEMLEKPDPRFFQRALTRAGTGPDDTVLVGDSLSADIAGAHGAGWRSVWLNPSGANRPPAYPVPDWQIRSLHGLPSILFPPE